MKSHVIQYEAGSWQHIHSNDIQTDHVNLILVYADRLLLEKQEMLESLQHQYPKAKLIVCSTAGEIYQRSATEGAATAIIIEAFHSDFGSINTLVEVIEKSCLSAIILLRLVLFCVKK